MSNNMFIFEQTADIYLFMENWNVREHENTYNMQKHVKNSNYYNI